jgi:hypothetical protein
MSRLELTKRFSAQPRIQSPAKIMKKTDPKHLAIKNLQSEAKGGKGGVPLDFEDEEEKQEFFDQ